jgi:hypothetical protein
MAIKVHIKLRVVIDGKSTFREAVQGANSRLEPLTTIFRVRKQTHTKGTSTPSAAVTGAPAIS